MTFVGKLAFLICLATQSSARDPFIVGGVKAPRGAYPWTAALILNGRFGCGGSLITRTHVLTARHCAPRGSRISAVLGEYIRSRREGTEQTIPVSRVIPHPSYDVAILELSRAAVLNKYVKIIALASSNPPAGRIVTVSGWGWTRSMTQSPADVLQHTRIPVTTARQCDSERLYLRSHEICAGNSRGLYINVCHLDSGTAMVQVVDGAYQQVGITSRGNRHCPKTAHYAVFVSVAFMRNWIYSHLGGSTTTTAWTGWYNRDTPRGSGDYEIRSFHRPVPCGGRTPIGIERRIVSTSNCKSGCSSAARQVITMSPSYGFKCKNNRQPGNCRCCDYAVRYKCP